MIYFQQGDLLLEKCKKPTGEKNPHELTHQEHGNIVLEPGTYRVDRVREYDHFAEEARRVAD
jgi:hypothetical protein